MINKLEKRAVLALLVLATGALLPSAAASQSDSIALSLERAIELATAASPELSAAQARLESAAAQGDLAASRRGPRLDFEAAVKSTDNPVMVFSQKLLQESFTEQDLALGRLNSPSMNEDFSARVVGRQPLYTGGKIRRGINSADQTRAGFEALEEATRQRLVREVADLYTAALVAERRVVVAEKTLATAQAHLDLTTSLFEGGLVVESDRLLAEVRRSEVEAALLQSRASREVSRAALNLAIGQRREQPLLLTTEFSTSFPEGDASELSHKTTLAQKTTSALSNRPDLQALSRFHAAALEGELAARAGFKPDLGLEASVEAHDSDFFGFEGTNSSLMLGLRLPLFDSGQRKATRKAAEARVLEAQAEIERLEDAIELEVAGAFFHLEVARQKQTLAQNSLSLAERSLEIIEDRYRHGLTTLVDLLEAQSTLSDSEVRVLDAERDEVLARVALLLATGEL